MEFQTFPLTHIQQTAYEYLDAGSNRCAVYRLEGELDEVRLAEAIEQTLQRCPPFSFKCMKGDDGLQILVSPDREKPLEVIDAADEATAYTLIDNTRRRVFRLDGGAPYQFVLLRGASASHLIFVCHPWIIDRFSLKPFFAALSRAYNGEAPGDALGLPQDLLVEQERARIASPQHDESMRFWLQIIREASFEWRPTRLETEVSDNYFSVALPAPARVLLAQVAERLELGVDELLLFCFHIFLHRMTRNDTIMTVGCHRIRSGEADGIGFSENKPVLRSLIDPEMPAKRFFRQAQRLLRQVNHHADMPAGMIAPELQRLGLEVRFPSNVLFTEDNLPYRELALDGVRATLLPHFSHRLESEDLAVYFDIQDEITLHVLARSPQEIPGLRTAFAHYLVLLEHLHEDLERPLGAMYLADDKLRDRALTLSDGGALREPPEDVVAALARLCAQAPDSPAVRYADRSLTYRALSLAAGSIAAHLEPALARRDEPLVGLCLGRSERMIQAVFGVLAADAGYLPLDPTMPAERLAFIVSDARLAAVIADRQTSSTIAPLVDCPLLDVDDLLDRPRPLEAPKDLALSARRTAYVIYTSGTTGKPKGVVIERGMLAHFVASLDGFWERGPGSRWMQFASLNFDASVLEIFSPLTHGGELVIAPAEVRSDPQAIFALLREARITHSFMPPAMLRLLPRRPLPELKSLCCGGEATDEESVRFWSKTLALANVYGPTEATVMATFNRMGGFKSANQLGRPLPGYTTYIVDADGELCPIGGVGEICIGGKAVAREYLGRPELTAQKFAVNRFGAGRVYHSGDLGRFLPNGDIEFLGRCDFQVKIRGFRIELGDIENAIAEQPEVKGCYVGVFDRPGGKAVLAWYIAPGLAPEVLRTRLAERLPHYMVPAFVIPVDAFPLNLSGKIDRTRLPQPESGRVAPQALDELGRRIRDVWAGALGVAPETIGAASHFFHLGGHSLLAALVCNRLNANGGGAIRPKALFEHPLFADFCEQVRSTPPATGALKPLLPSGRNEAPCQSRIIRLIHSRAMLVADDNTYNIVVRIDFSADIHPVRLRKVFWELLEERPEFRIALEERGEEIWIAARDVPLPAIPLVDTTCAATDARAQAMRSEVLGVTQAPLWRGEIHCREDGTSTLLFNVHHAIFDGWSFNLLIDELGERYAAAQAGAAYHRPRLSWFDYGAWARELAQTPAFRASVDYWKGKLTGVSTHVELPADFRQRLGNANAALPLRIEPDTVAALKALADAQDVTLSPLMFSLWLVWLWRISGQEALSCGYPYAGRDVPGSEEIYGMFVTMGVLCQSVRPEQTLADLTRAVHRQMLEDKDHLVATPFDSDVGEASSNNVVFSLQSGIGLEGQFGGAHYKADELPSLTSKADLTGIFYQSGDGGIEGRIEYDASLFKEETVAGFLDALRTLINCAARSPQARVGDLDYMSEAERARFLAYACGPQLSPSEQRECSIPERFAQIVAVDPQAVALVFGERRTSYRELDAWSDRLAAGLARRVAPGSRVGLAMHKSDALIASVLGILKLGCAYVPLDPSYPPDRLRFFAQNAGVRCVVADAPSRATLCAIGLDALDYLDPQADPAPASAPVDALPPVAPDALAYIIHTSGSTGQPKGVMIEHASVVRLAAATAPAIDLRAGDVGSLVASMNFDASVLEIFTLLLNGRTLVVVPEEARKSPAMLHQVLREQRVTHAMLSPVVLQNLPREPLPALKMIGFGGDAIDEQSADWWSRQTRLFTLYGPTETTVMSSCGQILPGANARVIGKPLAGYRMYLLNAHKEPVPMGAVGEICIGGANLARGYLKRDDLTLERFVIDPFGGSPYALMYLSGDLGRFLPDGTIEFFGRNDAQVKVRGFRIELGEIENHLGSFPGMRHVACAAKGEGDNRYLAAYYVADAALDEEAMRRHVGSFLPEYMVPAFFLRLDALPASPSGKIDRKALPEISGKEAEHPPRAGIEQSLAAIWEDILRFRGIGRDESFFRVGGNSLLAVRMQSEVQKKLGLEFSMSEFYGAPTIEALAARQQTDFVAQAIDDSQAPVASVQAAETHAAQPPRRVLLTGASGFLGVYLLAELSARVERVFCLQRGDDAAQGLAAIRRQADKAGLAIDWSRVEAIPGDLAAADLGLAPDTRRRLAGEVDAIVHCGAFVHHLHSYQTMKAANVDSTESLLRLALEETRKAFCFVSTLSVADALDGITAAPEAIVDNRPLANVGYLLTKWVAEQRVARYAAQYGLDAVIARPGNITGCSASGFSNFEHNHFWLFNKGCLQLGAYPETPARVEMTPVDRLARAIAALALAPRQGLAVRNLANPQSLSLPEFFARLAGLGFAVAGEAPAVWQRRLAAIGEDNALAQIRDFYTGDLSVPSLPTEQGETLAELARLGAGLDVDYDALLATYVRYLREAGFLA